MEQPQDPSGGHAALTTCGVDGGPCSAHPSPAHPSVNQVEGSTNSIDAASQLTCDSLKHHRARQSSWRGVATLVASM